MGRLASTWSRPGAGLQGGQVPKYIVNFGSVKVGKEGDTLERVIKVGEEIELDVNDPLVVNKHRIMTVDREGQPIPVDPERWEPQVVTVEQWDAIQRAKEALEAARAAMAQSQAPPVIDVDDEPETPRGTPTQPPATPPATPPPATSAPSAAPATPATPSGSGKPGSGTSGNATSGAPGR